MPAGRCPVVSDGHARLPGVWSVDLTAGAAVPVRNLERLPESAPSSNRNISERAVRVEIIIETTIMSH